MGLEDTQARTGEEQVRPMEPEEKAQAAETEEAAENAEARADGDSATPEEGTPEKMDLPVTALTKGQIVDGLIVHMDESGALVDVGTKSEGHIPADELTGEEGEKPLGVGDRVSVYVVRPEDADGNPILSKRIADYERTWRHLTEAFEQGEVLSAMVTDRVKGGLVVDLGVRGFLPASHVQARNVHALDRFLGQTVKVKILEVDRARKRVVVSQRRAIEDERRRKREQTLAKLKENEVYKGVVRRITDYGAFVDLGGVDGLLHITEMSWTRIGHPSEVVKVGEKIDVVVLRHDRETNRISLGLKQILPDPWEEIRQQLKVGQNVTGKISRLIPAGAFVRLENGVEAIVPNSELPGGRGQKAQEVLKVGQEVEAKVINIRPKERKLTLSLRLVAQAKERQELKEYLQRQEESGRVTIGDLVGEKLASAQSAAKADKVAEPEQSAYTPEAAPEQPKAEEAAPEEAKAAETPPEAEEEAKPAAKEAEEVKDSAAEPEPQAEPKAEASETEEPTQASPCSSSESPAESEAEKA